jgi:transcriptional regulator with XRE-family HTH domain
MKRVTDKMSDQIRQAIDSAGVSRYAICKAAAIDQATMSRFMAGGRLTMPKLDDLAEVLGLAVVNVRAVKVLPPEKLGRKPKAKKGR